MVDISVIIPVYNAKNYLERCINSVINQSLSNIEIILVDDGSTDGSNIILDSIAQIDNRIRIIQKLNGGPSSARNVGLIIASGDYVSFIDSDDWIEPKFLEEMYLMGKKFDSDIVTTGIKVDYELEDRSYDVKIQNDLIFSDKEKIGELFLELQKKKLFNYPFNKIYKNDFLKRIKIEFNEHLSVGEDFIFNLRAFSHAQRVLVNSSSLYHYVKMDNITLTSNFNAEFKAGGLLQIKELELFLSNFSFSESRHIELLNSSCLKYNVGFVLNLYKSNNPYKFWDRYYLLKKEIFQSGLIKNYIFKTNFLSIQDKLFEFTFGCGSPLFMNIVFSFLFFLRRNFEVLYIRLRPYLLKSI